MRCSVGGCSPSVVQSVDVAPERTTVCLRRRGCAFAGSRVPSSVRDGAHLRDLAMDVHHPPRSRPLRNLDPLRASHQATRARGADLNASTRGPGKPRALAWAFDDMWLTSCTSTRPALRLRKQRHRRERVAPSPRAPPHPPMWLISTLAGRVAGRMVSPVVNPSVNDDLVSE